MTGHHVNGGRQADPKDSAVEVFVALPSEMLDTISKRVAAQLAAQAPRALEPWLGVAEAALYLACTRKRIYDLVAARRLRVARDGRRLLFRRSWLDATLDRGSPPHGEVGSS